MIFRLEKQRIHNFVNNVSYFSSSNKTKQSNGKMKVGPRHRGCTLHRI